MPGASTGPRPWPLSSVWLAKRVMAARFLVAVRGGSGIRSARSQGTRESPGDARGQAQVEPGDERGERRREVVLAGGQAGVGQAEPDHLGRAGAEGTQGRGRFRGPPSCEYRRGGVPLMGAFAIGDCHQPQPRPRRRQHRHEPAGAEHPVIGVGGHEHGARHAGQHHSCRAALSGAA
jgi:hypothetical protein